MPSQPIAQTLLTHSKSRLDGIFLLLLAAAGILFFSYLDGQALWQDEAESAMLAKSVIRYGYPRGIYEGYLINPVVLDYGSFGPGEAWSYHSWLPIYLTAASFKLFGFTTWAARFPFVLIGWFSLFVIYSLAMRLFKEQKIALVAVALSITSVLICLLFRQCRYYAPQVLFCELALLFYVRLIERFSARSVWALFLSLLAFFHTTWGFFVPVAVWLVFDMIYFKRWGVWPECWKKHFVGGCILLFVFAAPWFLICHPEKHSAPLTFREIWRNAEFSIRMINKFIFPFALNALLFAWIFFKQKSKLGKLSLKNAALWVQVLIPFIIINTLFTFILKHRMIRYYIHLFPLYYMIQAWILVRLAGISGTVIPLLVFALIQFTNIAGDSTQYLFHSFDFKKNVVVAAKETRFYFLDYLYEITHRYDGPVSSAVEYMKQHAKPGEEIKVPIAGEPESFQFYLPDQRVLNSLFFGEFNFPDWMVPRDYWVRQELLRAKPEDLPRYEAYLDEIGRRYERIVLNTYDIIWENRPDDLGYHKFRTVTDGLYRTMIYRKLSEEEYQKRLSEGWQEKVTGRGFDRQPLIPTIISS